MNFANRIWHKKVKAGASSESKTGDGDDRLHLLRSFLVERAQVLFGSASKNGGNQQQGGGSLFGRWRSRSQDFPAVLGRAARSWSLPASSHVARGGEAESFTNEEVVEMLLECPYCVTDLLVDSSLSTITSSTAPPSDGKQLIQYLVHCVLKNLEYDEKQQNLLKIVLQDVLQHEVANTKDMNTLFRENQSVGAIFLKTLAQKMENAQFVDMIIEAALTQSASIDTYVGPKNRNEGEVSAMKLVSRLLNELDRHQHEIPLGIKLTCQVLYETAPTMLRDKLLSGFFFLKCLNPVLVARKDRLFVDAARILQNVANQSKFQNSNDAALYNKFVMDNQPRVKMFMMTQMNKIDEVKQEQLQQEQEEMKIQ